MRNRHLEDVNNVMDPSESEAWKENDKTGEGESASVANRMREREARRTVVEEVGILSF